MLVCERPELTASTGLRCNGVELCNRLDLVHWQEEDRIQVLLCEDCWHPGCAVGGYVRISRLGSFVLWTPGRFDPTDDFEASEYRAADFLATTGAIAIETETWETFRAHVPELPAADEFPPTERMDLRAAWELEAPDRPELAEQRIVAAPQSNETEVASRIRAIVTWFAADAHAAVAGDLVRVSDADVEDVYLDVPDTFDRPVLREWHPYARRAGRLSPAFRGNWTVTPAPIDES